MAHVHLEDGAFSPLWLLIWSAIAAILIAIALLANRRKEIPPRKIAIAAMCASVGFAVFMVEVPTPVGPVHMNFTPLIGILAGPGMGSLVALVINIFGAAVGHGGWGMVGPNSIVNIVEVVIGYYTFRLFKTRSRTGDFWSGFSATTIALAISAFLVVLIVSVSEIQGSNLTRGETLNNMLILAVANIVAAVVEGIVTGYIVSFLGRVRPDLIGAEAVPLPGNRESLMTSGGALDG
ncbi:MAG: energy-coupling factor ABC transporter permease [Euryarchaeota archaeon]|nr:energy-coupling factor ABC transporter permease [Euryarchaeota archaeon]